MTKEQFQREQLLKRRDRELDLLAQVQANIDPMEASNVAGFWLEHQAPEGMRGRF